MLSHMRQSWSTARKDKKFVKVMSLSVGICMDMYVYHSSSYLCLTYSHDVQSCKKLIKGMQGVMQNPAEITDDALWRKLWKRFTNEQHKMGKHVDEAS